MGELKIIFQSQIKMLKEIKKHSTAASPARKATFQMELQGSHEPSKVYVSGLCKNWVNNKFQMETCAGKFRKNIHVLNLHVTISHKSRSSTKILFSQTKFYIEKKKTIQFFNWSFIHAI